MQVKKIVFNQVPEDHVFGYMPTVDPEGAREITMIWKSHTSSPGADARPDGKPNLDFTAMNKLAAKRWDGLGLKRTHERAPGGLCHPVLSGAWKGNNLPHVQRKKGAGWAELYPDGLLDAASLSFLPSLRYRPKP